jgi:hypothetical protein
MKTTVVRSLMVFLAGAGCATVIAQVGEMPPPPITVEDWQKRAIRVSDEIAFLAQYVDLAENGRNRIFTDPAACVTPVPPKPNRGAKLWLVRKGLGAIETITEGQALGEEELVYSLERCHPKGD